MKKISELNREELKTLFHTNNKLQYEVQSDYEESEMDHISEILDSFKPTLRDWSIGFNNYNKLEVNNLRKFVEGAMDAQNNYCFLSDEWTSTIELLLSKYKTFDRMDYNNQNYEDFENWLEEKAQEVVSAVLEQFEQMTQYNDEYILDYFLEFYAESRMDESFYLDDAGKLFEHIEYEKSYH